METSILALSMALKVLSTTPVSSAVLNYPLYTNSTQAGQLLASREIGLYNRYPDAYVNGVFRDNILLNIAYMFGKVNDPEEINWDNIRKPFHYELRLNTGEIFAFHEDVLDNYKGKISKTTNAHFNAQEGFKSDGFLYGDGVCHLATLINWAAAGTGLTVQAPTRHDFAPINAIPREYGVSIYYYPGTHYTNSVQNLYIKNDFSVPVILTFDYSNDTLKVSVIKDNNLVYFGFSGI